MDTNLSLPLKSNTESTGKAMVESVNENFISDELSQLELRKMIGLCSNIPDYIKNALIAILDTVS